MKSLLEAGVHFGHRTRRWHPKMRTFIFTERNGIHIIDLQQTMRQVNTAYGVVRDIVREGGLVLFVGTKKQAQETIQPEADRCGMPYVDPALAGRHADQLPHHPAARRVHGRPGRRRAAASWIACPRRKRLLLRSELVRLNTRIGGLRNDDPPARRAVHRRRARGNRWRWTEANKLHIPIVAMVDTNCDPDPIDYPIPSNDDAIRAIKLMAGKMADAVIEGLQMRAVDEADRAAAATRKRMSRKNWPRKSEPEPGDEPETATSEDEFLGPSDPGPAGAWRRGRRDCRKRISSGARIRIRRQEQSLAPDA